VLEVRLAADRFCTRTDWLTSWHSFSYGPWYDPDNVGFGPLVVNNQDVLAPGAGFDDHRHRDVDIVTFVVAGSLEHADSAGHHEVLRSGELQVLHSGFGVVHSERNASDDQPVEYVQMWIRSASTEVSYERGSASVVLPGGELTVVDLVPGSGFSLPEDGLTHVFVAAGSAVTAEGLRLAAGDAVRADGCAVGLAAQAPSIVLVWRLRDRLITN
jgi:quercetin 2,3-dioxygenase